MHFSKIITSWYSIHKRDLPWRHTQNPYHVWLSEIILQQTQVNQGLPYYETFVKNFPTVFQLAETSEENVLKFWQGLGYYSRARNLHHTAQTVVDKYNGIFPVSYKELITLKGIGDYTASAIASICNDEPCAVVDGNVYRLLARFFGVDTPINSTQGIKEFKLLAQDLLPKHNIGEYNQAIMEFGSRQCKPQNPKCDICPINTACVALKKGMVSELPVKINKTKIRKRYFNYLVMVSDDDKTIVRQRKGKGIWQNLYEFPLIETDKSIDHKSFNEHKEIRNLINGHKVETSLFNEKDIIHKLSHQQLHTKFWIINIDKLPENGIDTSLIYKFPVPVLIKNFLQTFSF